MKIEINDKGSNNYYDEFLFIANNYKKIHKNPNIKIKKMSTNLYLYLFISLIIFTIFLVWYIIAKETIQFGITIFFAILILMSILLIYLTKKNISKASNSHVKTTFEITKEYVGIKNENVDYKLNFDEIKNVIMGNYTISFVTNDINKKFIVARIEHKDEIINALKKYNKDNLIIE